MSIYPSLFILLQLNQNEISYCILFFLCNVYFCLIRSPFLCQVVALSAKSNHRRCSVRKGVLWHRFFSCEFCEIFKNAVFTEHLWTTASLKLLTPPFPKPYQLFFNSTAFELIHGCGKSRSRN